MKGKWPLILFIIGVLVITAIALGAYFGFKSPPAAGEIAIPVTDDLGRTVVIRNWPQRIVSLAPSSTEIVFALGLEDRVVGVTNQCDYPEEARTKSKVGDYWNPNVEVIMSLNPDLVLTDGYKPGLVSQLEGAGLTVIVLQPGDIDGIFYDIELVGRAAAKEQEAVKLITNMSKRIGAVTGKAKMAGTQPGVFYEGDCMYGIWTTGSGTFQDALITLAGGRNVAAVSESWYEITPEWLLDKDGEIDIIIWGDMGGVSPEDVKGDLPWSGLTAMQTGKVHVVDPDLVNRPGPRIVDCLEELARIIHPELF